MYTEQNMLSWLRFLWPIRQSSRNEVD